MKKRIFSGVAPSGDGSLHIGNYFGAIKQHIDSQNLDMERIFFIADYHAMNVVKDKSQLEENIINLATDYLSLGIDPNKTIFFRQSDVPIVAELQTILNNVTPLGLIKRAHAYKDKLQKGQNADSINMGLFCYPVLMAADILLYKADIVPVGKDQKQHLEISRDIATNFNKTYAKVFTLPEPQILSTVATIIGTDGKRKMSKSLGNIISIFADEKVIRKQIFSTYTDPNRIHPTDPGKVEGNTIFLYHDLLNQNKAEVEDLKKRYRLGEVSDVEVKEKLYSAHLDYFKEARERYAKYKTRPELVFDILRDGQKRATKIAKRTIQEVRESVGLSIY